jgi:hypothetical protein
LNSIGKPSGATPFSNRPPTWLTGLAALATIVTLVAPPAWAQLYRWSDSHGTVYYTTDLATIPPSYRDSARDIGAPTPGPPPAPAPTPPVAAGVTIPYTGGPLIVNASLNGVPLRLIVDTGADRTLISPAAMARAGFDVTQGTAVQIRGVTGDAVATLVSVPRLDLAGTRVGPVAVVVLDAFTVTMDAASQRAILVPR